jgi:hypothetical protein
MKLTQDRFIPEEKDAAGDALSDKTEGTIQEVNPHEGACWWHNHGKYQDSEGERRCIILLSYYGKY